MTKNLSTVIKLFTLSIYALQLSCYGANPESDFTYTDDGTSVTITKYIGTGSVVIVPDTIGGLPVTEIGVSSFTSKAVGGSNIPTITSIVLPDSVTTIHDNAFFYQPITSIDFGDGLVELGKNAITNTDITTLNLPATFTTFGENFFDREDNRQAINSDATIRFKYTQLHENDLVAINVDPANTQFQSIDGVLYSGDGTELLRFPTKKSGNFVLPMGVTEIAEKAFLECNVFQSADLDNGSLTTVGSSAFKSCTALASATLPNDVQVLPDYLFSYCTSLSSLTLGNNITTVGEWILERTIVPTITIPATVSSIQSTSFSDNGLASIAVDASNTNYLSIDGVLYSKDGTLLISYPSEKTDNLFTLPAAVTRIGTFAFYDSVYPKTADLDNGLLDTIEQEAFLASEVESVILGDTLLTIADEAFAYTYHLGTLDLGASVQSIGYRAFYDSGMQNLIIPQTVVSVGIEAFAGNGGLFSLLINNAAFEIPDRCFEDSYNLSSLDLGNAITGIGDYAFYRMADC